MYCTNLLPEEFHLLLAVFPKLGPSKAKQDFGYLYEIFDVPILQTDVYQFLTGPDKLVVVILLPPVRGRVFFGGYVNVVPCCIGIVLVVK